MSIILSFWNENRVVDLVRLVDISGGLAEASGGLAGASGILAGAS